MGQDTTNRPNILCFVTDQHRADHLGCYGNRQVRTPNIDRLAAEGITFTESYAANPVCMPNRASMFTGRYPKAHGLRENGLTLSHDEIVLPEVLRSAGYETISVGKLHLAPYGIKSRMASCPEELYESGEYWENGGDLPLPYYGLERVCVANGHGAYAFGHYKRWLNKNHPGSYEMLRKPLEPQTGTREAWKASIPAELHYNNFIADNTIEMLKTRDKSRPFFTWCSFPDPHHPFSPPRPYCDMYNPAEIEFNPSRREDEMEDLPEFYTECYKGERLVGGLRGDVRKVTDDNYREILAMTYGMVTLVDDCIGRILKWLEKESLLDNTIIVFFSDHGDLMGDHWLINKGPFLYRGLVRVPTIWRIPGAPRQGKTSSEMISAVDLCPTLLDFAGVQIPDGVQGNSYRNILSGGDGNGRDSVYIEYDESYINDRLRQIRTRDYALTYFSETDTGILFDLKKDPQELYNVWDSPKYESIKLGLLLELLKQTSRADDWLPEKKVHA